MVQRLAIVACLLIALVPSGSNGAVQPLTTSAFISSNGSQSVQQGTPGVIVSYNNTLSVPEFAYVYMIAVNIVGQVVVVSVSGSYFAPHQQETFFFGLTGYAHGKYVVNLFVATGEGVPISVVTKVAISL